MMRSGNRTLKRIIQSEINQAGSWGKWKTKMKKLMIVAAAALWATVGMADVESANIVG